MEETSTTNPLNTSELPPHKGWFSLHHTGTTIVLALAILVAAGAIAWWQMPKPDQNPVDATANWKTYRNEQYGFEFKYPQDWHMDSTQHPLNLSNYQNANSFNLGNTPSDLESIFISFGTVGPMFKLDDLKQSLDKYQQLVKFETITSNSGVEGRYVIVYSDDHPVGNHTSATFAKGGQYSGITVTFSLGVNSEDQSNLLRQILSTFKFIDSSTADWKTYRNEQYGFEFKYPDKVISVQDGYISSIDPKDWVMVVDFHTIPHGQDRYGVFVVRESTLDQLLETEYKQSYIKNFSGEDTLINGIVWKKISYDITSEYSENMYPGVDYLLEHDNLTFELGFSPDLNVNPDQILSTFRFIE